MTVAVCSALVPAPLPQTVTNTFVVNQQSVSKSVGTVERCNHGGLLGRCGLCAGRAIAEANAVALQAREARVARELHEQQEGLKENKLKGEISAAYDLLLEKDISDSDSHDQELRMRGPAARNPLVSPKFSRKVHVGAQKKLPKERDHSGQVKHCTWP